MGDGVQPCHATVAALEGPYGSIVGCRFPHVESGGDSPHAYERMNHFTSWLVLRAESVFWPDGRANGAGVSEL